MTNREFENYSKLPKITIEFNLPEELRRVPLNESRVECIFSECNGTWEYGLLPPFQVIARGSFVTTLTGLYGWMCSECGAKLLKGEVVDVMNNRVDSTIRQHLASN